MIIDLRKIASQESVKYSEDGSSLSLSLQVCEKGVFSLKNVKCFHDNEDCVQS